MVFWGTVFAVVQVLMRPKLEDGENCGIPIIWYDYMWISIFSSMGFAGLLTILVGLISASETATAATWGASVMLILLGMIIWTTYGYFLIGSE